jgi:rare lipoprotein A
MKSTCKYQGRLSALFIISALLMTGCASQQKARQPSATVTSQPRASQKPYTVLGKRYEPLVSYNGFREEGIASSYGSDFHGKKTSSGEPFNMHAMTAAHKTLPLGVYVKVQHKRNKREVVVRINDRGPFVRERIIDLSEEAAKRLGMLQEGVAPVKIAALGYKQNSTSESETYNQPDSYDTGNFTLQAGAFKVKENAYRYAADLRAKHGSADVQETSLSGSTYYRVRMGRYTSLKTAQSAAEKFGQSGFTGIFAVARD